MEYRIKAGKSSARFDRRRKFQTQLIVLIFLQINKEKRVTFSGECINTNEKIAPDVRACVEILNNLRRAMSSINPPPLITS